MNAASVSTVHHASRQVGHTRSHVYFWVFVFLNFRALRCHPFCPSVHWRNGNKSNSPRAVPREQREESFWPIITAVLWWSMCEHSAHLVSGWLTHGALCVCAFKCKFQSSGALHTSNFSDIHFFSPDSDVIDLSIDRKTISWSAAKFKFQIKSKVKRFIWFKHFHHIFSWAQCRWHVFRPPPDELSSRDVTSWQSVPKNVLHVMKR